MRTGGSAQCVKGRAAKGRARDEGGNQPKDRARDEQRTGHAHLLMSLRSWRKSLAMTVGSTLGSSLPNSKP